MTILHVLEPFASGITTAVSSIARELPDYRHIVIHGTRNWTESAEKVKTRFPRGVTFVEWKFAGREISLVNDFKAMRRLMVILRPYAPGNMKIPDSVTVHLHSSKAGFLGRLVCRILGIKTIIYTPHCGAFLRTDIGQIKRKLYFFLEWIGSLFGGRIVGCGPSEGEIYKKLRKNTTYVSNGVAVCKEQIINNREQPERNLVSFTGIASFQKDPAFWSDVAASCADHAGEAGYSFCWVGDGPEALKLNKDCVTVTGWKTAREVDELLNRTAVYFSASAWEGLPYGVLEAMSSGCALLLRDVPGNRDLVIPGENGRLFKTREEAIDSLKKILNDKELLASMGKRSREIAERDFSLKQMGEGYRKIYLSFHRGTEID